MSKALDSQRTYALIGTGGCGKTSLAEMLLFQSGVINRLGAIEEGTTTLDYEPEEIKRRGSIQPGFATFLWNKAATSSWTSPATPTLPVTFPTC